MPDISNLKTIADLFDVTLDSLVNDVEALETTEESFCWKLAFAFGCIGLILGFLLNNMAGINMGALGIGGGIIGYIVGYIILEIRKQIK